MPIPRQLAPVLEASARHYPVVTVTGPRQSGKTTLARMAFPQLAYVSLEPLDQRTWAQEDPRGFLAQFPQGAILDEVQHAPDLVSYLQVRVDEDPTPGRFVLTGSQHMGLSQLVSQSLAGRTAVHHLLPLSLAELHRFPSPPADLLGTLWTGAYPRIHDRGVPAGRWLADYVTTYVQRDVRQLHQVGDLEAFTTLLRLAAGRTGQEINLSRLGGDAGVTHNTVRSWLSVLEASFLIFRLPPWHRNLRKRLVKAPKLHFVDSGLVCWLLGIISPEQLRTHPLRGAVFESWVAAELLKARWHQGAPGRMFHLRQNRGAEVDLVLERGSVLSLVECKSGATVAADFLDNLLDLERQLGPSATVELTLVHGGEGVAISHRRGVRLVPWRSLAGLAWGDPGA